MSIILTGTILLGMTGLLASILLLGARAMYSPQQHPVVTAINDLLPQTQCAQCGYPGCRPYAEAIARGEAINRCPPGGDETIRALSVLLGKPAEPLDPAYGTTKPQLRAIIREAECIGCTLCIQACPVDAILGAQQAMHTVIAKECTGCELCVAPCPVDCIDLVVDPVPGVSATQSQAHDECIRCNACDPACPKDLSPLALYWYRDSVAKLDELDINACIECRRCDRVCPSAIPLTDYFSQAKADLRAANEAEATARHVAMRVDRREARLSARKVRIRARPSSSEKASLLAGINRERQ